MLKDFFNGKINSNDSNSFSRKFTSPSQWIPPWSSITDDTKKTINKIFQESNKIMAPNTVGEGSHKRIINKHNGANLAKNEYKALMELKNEQSIIIKPADKGGALVIMDRDLYITEGLRQLDNPLYYESLTEPIYHESISLINNQLQTLLNTGYINDKQFSYLAAPPDAKQRQFYLLPKIHKSREKWPDARMPEGRPIVSDVGSETYRITEYIDYFLKPLSTTHEAYIKDTYDFVEKIRDKEINRTDLLVTGDVTALYTNMKIELILKAVKEIFQEFPVHGRPDKELLNLLEITLTRNDFVFGDRIFKQICGTAMGKRYAPSLADIYLRTLDHAAMHGFHIKPKVYWRYLDDIYLIWPGTRQQLQEYQDFLNSVIPGISITLTARNNIIEFLDTRTYKYTTEDNKCLIKTKIYFKPTDTHQLLHKKSYHPQHTFRGLLKSQFIRFKRISSFKIEYDEACNILKKVLIHRGYSSRFFRKIKSEIWRDTTIVERRKNSHNAENKTSLLPIITFYNNIGAKLNRTWKTIISENKILSPLFHPISAYRIHKNLGRYLIRSTLRPIQPSTVHNTTMKVGFTCCPNTRCKACNFISESSTFNSTHSNKIFHIKHKFTCKSTSIIYLITCKLCYKQYVGETGRSLSQRTTDHLSCIRLKKHTPVALHFNLPAHSIHHFSIQPIEHTDSHNNSALINIRRYRETLWQQRLNTLHPRGFNNLNTSNIN